METLLIRAFRQQAEQAASLLKALANESRLLVLCHLAESGELCVGQLQACVGLSQSALSQHLARLREAKVVKTRRESQTIYYSLANQGVKRLIDVLYELYCRPAHRGRRL